MSRDFNTPLSSSCLTCKKAHQKCVFLIAEHTCQRCKRLSRKCPMFDGDLMLSPQVVGSNDPPLGDAIPLSVDETLDVCDESRLELLGDSLVHQTRCTEGTDGVFERTDSRLSNVSIPQCPVILPIKDQQVIQQKNQIITQTPHHPFGVSFVAKSKSSLSGRQKAAFIKSKLTFVQSSAQSRRNKSKQARKKAKKK